MAKIIANPFLPPAVAQAQYAQFMNQQSGGILPLILQAITGNQTAFNEAKQANLDRYNDILEMFGVTRGRVMKDLADFGQSRVDEENRNWDNTRHNLITDLGERGLPGFTNRIPVETKTTEGRNRGLREIQDQLREIRSNADERFTDKATGVMERRTDAYPGGDATGLASALGALLGGGGLGQLAGGNLGGVLQGLTGGGTGLMPYNHTPYNQEAVLRNTPPAGPAFGSDKASKDAAAYNQALQNSKLTLKQAMDSGGGIETQDRVNAAQQAAMYGGYANWNPAQTAPTVPGAPPALLDLQQSVDPRLANAIGSQPVAPVADRGRTNPYGMNYFMRRANEARLRAPALNRNLGLNIANGMSMFGLPGSRPTTVTSNTTSNLQQPSQATLYNILAAMSGGAGFPLPF